MLKILGPYLIVSLLAVVVGAGIDRLINTNKLVGERAARALDNQRHAEEVSAMSRAALDVGRRAIDAHYATEVRISAIDTQFIKERNLHETESRDYRTALAAGIERVRVAVSKCQLSAATVCPELPAPPAWVMVSTPTPTQTSTERLRNAFFRSPETMRSKSTK